jgi:RimJ/RimL family protein N-acetyltransferase
VRHSISLTCVRYRLRPVALDDAPFIVGLRTDPLLNRFVHETSPRIEDQVVWLERYFERPGDYYFIVEDARSGEARGTIGLYEIADDASEALFGRWIIRRSSVAALESAWLIYEAGFSLLEVGSVYTLALAQNLPVVSFHDSFGASRIGVVGGRFTVRGEPHSAVEHRITAAEWPAIRDRHYSTITRVAHVDLKSVNL